MSHPPPAGASMPPLAYQTPTLPFRGRKGALIGFGVVLLLMGAFCLLAAAMAVLSLVLTRLALAGAPQQDGRSVILSASLYACLAALFGWTGIGSIRCRRWVRPIVRIIAWAWLVAGVLSLVMTAILTPQMMSTATTTVGATVPPGVMYAIIAIGLLINAVFMVALPGLFVWFYRRDDVRQTLDYFDPGPAWTDRCPTSVLGVSLGMWVTAVMMCPALLYAFMPFFGVMLTGAPAMAVAIIAAAMLAYAGWTSFQLRPVGWWTSTLVLVLITVSTLLTFVRVDMAEMYRAMNFPADQVEAIAQFGDSYRLAVLLCTAVFGLACVGYMFYVRKHFVAAPVVSAEVVSSSS